MSNAYRETTRPFTPVERPGTDVETASEAEDTVAIEINVVRRMKCPHKHPLPSRLL
jgi:hypothetical protein